MEEIRGKNKIEKRVNNKRIFNDENVVGLLIFFFILKVSGPMNNKAKTG
jgi:hypothetical protein